MKTGGLLQRLITPLTDIIGLIRERYVKPADLPLAPIAHSFHLLAGYESRHDLEEIGDFVAVSSQLLLLKSRALMPWLDYVEEELLIPTRERVRDITAFDDTLADLVSRSLAHTETFARPDHSEPPPAIIDLQPISASHLARALDQQLSAMEERRVRHIAPPRILLRIEEATRRLRESLGRVRSLSFRTLIQSGRLDRRAAVVYFLAILDLARKQVIGITQDAPFADILVEEHQEQTAAETLEPEVEPVLVPA